MKITQSFQRNLGEDEEYIRRATPLIEPMDIEYNGRLCHTTFDMLDRVGAFGSSLDRPPPLHGQKIEGKVLFWYSREKTWDGRS